MKNITLNGKPITENDIAFFVAWPVSPISEVEDDDLYEEKLDEITQNFQRCRSFMED